MIIFTTYRDREWRQANSEMSWGALDAQWTLYDDSDRDLDRNEFNTPILPALFEKVERNHLKQDIFAYVNSDIILLPDFVEAIDILDKLYPRFLMVGRRWNWNKPRPISLDDLTRHKAQFVDEVRTHGRRFNAATDILGFRRGTFDYDAWPRFAIGRYFWDSWVFFHAMQVGIPVIDVTKAVFMIHQNHPVGHRSWDAEGRINRELAEDVIKAGADLDSVPYEMTEDLRTIKRDGL